MNILQYPAYISINEYKEFSRNISGYGYMTIEIACSIAEHGIHVDLLTQSNITKGLNYRHVNILKRTWCLIISNFRFRDAINAIKIIIRDKVSFSKYPNVFLYYISMGYFNKIISEKSYDLVHIHGIGHYTLPIIDECEKNNMKYVVTLHGLYSFSNSIKLSNLEKTNERRFLNDAFVQKIPVNVISSGIRKTILNYLTVNHSDNFKVITNGVNTKIASKKSSENLREKYNIPSERSIIICVGNIGLNKNQIQIVRAFALLPDEIKNNLTLLFLGLDFTNGQVNKEIRKLNLSNNIIVCGNIPKAKIHDYYKFADYNIIASFSEGFGLSIIEGFIFGIPTVTFADLDAVTDVYIPEAMILVEDRTDEELKNGMLKMIMKEWNKDEIIKHSKKFSTLIMASKYIEFYNEI